MSDEPVLGSEFDALIPMPALDPAVIESIRALVREKPYAVLCTQAEGQPYG